MKRALNIVRNSDSSVRTGFGVTLALQVVTWVVTLAALGLLSTEQHAGATTPGYLRHLSLAHWVGLVNTRWDAYSYQNIAEHGYHVANHTAAFFPLYPALLWALHQVLPMWAAALTISFVATWAAVVLMLRLFQELPGVDRRTALGSVVAWTVFPTAAFLVMGYPESLLAALMAGAWLAARRGHIMTWGVLAGLALLTRPLGIAAVPFLLCAPATMWRTWRLPAALAITVGIAAIWPIYLWRTLGSPIEFVHAQAHWLRSVHLTPTGIYHALRSTLSGLHTIFSYPVPAVARHGLVVPQRVTAAVENDLNFLFAAMLGFGALIAWRRFGAGPGLAALAVLVIPLLAINPNVPLLSLPRFCLTAIPVFPAFALWLRERANVRWALIATSCIFFGIYTTSIALERFVA